MERGRDAAMGDSLGGPGTISSSEEEVPRRSTSVSPGCSQFSSSSSSGSGPGGAPYWISHRAVSMRSASDSHRSSSSSSSSSDARSGGGNQVARSPEENRDAGDGEEGSRLPANGGDGVLGRVRGKKNCISKRKSFAAAGRSEKRLRTLSEESTQEPEGSPGTHLGGTVAGHCLGFNRSGKELGPVREDEDLPADPTGSEDDAGYKSARDDFAKSRHVITGLEGPESPGGGTSIAPQQRSPAARDPSDGDGNATGFPQLSGEGGMVMQGTNHSIPDNGEGEKGDVAFSPSVKSRGALPLVEGLSHSVQLQNPVEPEEEGPQVAGLGTPPPVKASEQRGEQRAKEKSPSGDHPSPEQAPGSEPKKSLYSSDLVDLLIKFSKKPDKRLEKVDFLEVLAMKGIRIPPPRWWRPGGYGPKKSEGSKQ